MNVSLQSSPAPPRMVNNTYRSITWSVPPFTESDARSGKASLCRLIRPDIEPTERDDGPVPAGMGVPLRRTGVPGIEPMPEDVSPSTSRTRSSRF